MGSQGGRGWAIVAIPFKHDHHWWLAEDEHEGLTTSWRSARARPLETELIRTACSFIPGLRGCSSRRRMLRRASAFFPVDTESSKSQQTQSTDKERDFSSIFWEDPGTKETESVVEW